MLNRDQLRLLQLQIQRRTPKFICIIDGELQQKGKRRSRDAAIDDIMFDLALDDALQQRLGLNADIVKWYREDLQQQLLALNKIDAADRPGGAKNLHIRDWIDKRYEELRPWSIYLGELPAIQGEAAQYKQNIRSQLKQLRSQFRVFNGIATPMEAQPKNDIRLKLLSIGSISRFEDKVDKLFNEADEWVKNKLRYF